MRFRLTLEVDRTHGDLLPLSYQYEQSAVIYKILSRGDRNYSSWLHDNGFKLESGKRFKLFCYSRLNPDKYRILPKAGCMNLIGKRAEWIIGFLPEKSTEHFVQGLFADQYFTLGNKDYQVGFHVINVELLPSIPAEPIMEWEAQSPVCVKEHTEGKTVFLSPEAPNYAEAILSGLLSRYESLYGHPYEGDIRGFQFELLSPQPKSALITIKTGTPQQTQIRGYRYRFRLTAPEELMHIASEGGIGEECSQGFGYIEPLNKTIK